MIFKEGDRMKIKDPEKLKKARNLINMLLEGINPLTYDSIPQDSFLNDPSMIRSFSYIGLVLSQDIKEAEEYERENSNKFSGRSTSSDIQPQEYKNINDRIKSYKLQVFNKSNLSDLKKLAEYMEKNENSV
jgi:hypothetical protein